MWLTGKIAWDLTMIVRIPGSETSGLIPPGLIIEGILIIYGF